MYIKHFIKPKTSPAYICRYGMDGLFLPLLLTILMQVFSCGKPSDTKSGTPGDVLELPPSISSNEIPDLISLTSREAGDLDIQTYIAQKDIHSYVMNVPGMVFPAPDHFAIISTPLSGKISEMQAKEGEPAKKGSILFRIESLELGVMVSDYLQALAEEEYYKARYERIHQLSQKEISSESELDKAQSDLSRAVTIARATSSKLRAAGLSEKEIAGYRHEEKIDPVLNIRSPINGVFDQRNVDLGQRVSAYQALGTVIDNSHVMIRGYLSPEDGRLVKPGDSVRITRRTEDHDMIPAKISTINPGLDETNRSAIANIYLKVPGNWPRPGENVRLEIVASSPEPLIAIPLRAITYDGNDPVVFIRKEEKLWEKRPVTLLEMRDTSAVVASGIQPDEELAVSQVFSLKALSRIDQIAEE